MVMRLDFTKYSGAGPFQDNRNGELFVSFLRGGFTEGGQEFAESVEIEGEALFSIEFGAVAEDSDGAAVAAAFQRLQHGEFAVAIADGEDFRAHFHAVDIDGEQVGEHLFEECGELIDLLMGVVEIVDDADVGHVDAADDGDLIFGFAEPASVVVKADFRVEGLGLAGESGDGFRGGFDFLFLGEGGEFLGGVEHGPEFGFELAALEEIEDGGDVVGAGRVHRIGGPEALELDALFLEGVDFAVEVGDVLISPIVDEFRKAEFLEEGGALFGAAVFGVEGDDAPGNEVVACKQQRGFVLRGGERESTSSVTAMAARFMGVSFCCRVLARASILTLAIMPGAENSLSLPLHSFQEGRGGPPLVFLHGVLRNGRCCTPVLPALGARCTVHGLDLRGHGASPEGGGYRVVDYLPDVVRYVRGLGEPAVLYGHSLGAMLAAAAAAEAADCVRAIVMEDPPFHTMGRRMRGTPLQDYFEKIEPYAGSTEPVGTLARRLGELRVQSGNGLVALSTLRDATALRFLASSLRHVRPAVLAPIVAGEWLEGYAMDEVFTGVRCPALLLQCDTACGGMLMAEDAERMEALAVDCTRSFLKGVGHQAHWAQAGEVSRRVLEFLLSLE